MRLKIFYCLLILILVLIPYLFIEPYLLRVHRVTFTSKDLPASFINKRIAFIADIHNGPASSIWRIRKMVKIINSLKPDIVILGGDYVHTDSRYIAPCFKELKKINALHGKYGILGNHDYNIDPRLTKAWLRNAGFVVLENQAIPVQINHDRIILSNVGGLFETDFNSTISSINKKDFVLLIAHSPDYAERITTDNVDYVISGHTHGGQVTFLGLWAPFVPSPFGQKYRAGMVQAPHTTVFVTTGIGTIGPPIRFFAYPEIVEILLRDRNPAPAS